jgi:hypothetical protein
VNEKEFAPAVAGRATSSAAVSPTNLVIEVRTVISVPENWLIGNLQPLACTNAVSHEEPTEAFDP